MTLLSEQLSAVRKSQWETQLDLFRNLGNRALDSTEQLVALNMNTSRRSMEQAAGTFRQLLDVRDPRDLFALGAATQGQWQQLFSYGRDLLGIATGTRLNTWTMPALPRMAAPQVLDQAAIAVADATTVVSEIAAAAADTGGALAEAALAAQPQAAQPNATPATPVAEPTELEAEKTREAPSEQPQADNGKAGSDKDAPAPTVDGAPVADTRQAATDPIDAVIAEEAPPARAKPVARAFAKVAPKPLAAEHPIAASVPLQANGHVELPIVAPVESTPPLHMPAQDAKPARGSRKR